MDKLLGKKIGKGVRRDVFEHKKDDSLVIKALLNKTDNHNILEMENWNNADEETKQFLAPCIEITYDGVYLTQKKGVPIKELSDKPSGIFFLENELPLGFLDKIKPYNKRGKFKRKNFIYIDGELKLCDYGERWHKILT